MNCLSGIMHLVTLWRDMMIVNQDNIGRAYALISSLRKNIDQPSINEFSSLRSSYVTEYHNALDLLEKCGFDVALFRTPDSELRP
jgi:hypothetical protein